MSFQKNKANYHAILMYATKQTAQHYTGFSNRISSLNFCNYVWYKGIIYFRSSLYILPKYPKLQDSLSVINKKNTDLQCY